jgi:hypothetical protein
MYPEINSLVDLLHGRGISTFLVTNAQVGRKGRRGPGQSGARGARPGALHPRACRSWAAGGGAGSTRPHLATPPTMPIPHLTPAVPRAHPPAAPRHAAVCERGRRHPRVAQGGGPPVVLRLLAALHRLPGGAQWQAAAHGVQVRGAARGCRGAEVCGGRAELCGPVRGFAAGQLGWWGYQGAPLPAPGPPRARGALARSPRRLAPATPTPPSSSSSPPAG